MRPLFAAHDPAAVTASAYEHLRRANEISRQGDFVYTYVDLRDCGWPETLQMNGAGTESVTRLLIELTNGNRGAVDALLPLIYDEPRSLAANYLRRERPDHTLQPTALVREAYLRLVDQREVNRHNRARFFGVAAQMMRRILIDHARAYATGSSFV
jgi:hypothetical protein